MYIYIYSVYIICTQIVESHGNCQVDEEQVRHAMADPEIQQILHVTWLAQAWLSNQRFAGCSSTLWVDSCTLVLNSCNLFRFAGLHTYHWWVLVTSCHSAAWGSSNQHVPERDAKQSSRSTEANDVGPSCGAFLVLGGWMFGRGCRLVGGWLSKKHLNRMGSCQMDPRSNSLSVTVMEAAYFKWTES